MNTPQPKRALHWDGTVTAGNVLTAASLLLPLLVWGLRLEGRVDLTEARQRTFEAVSERQRSEDKASEALGFSELRAGIHRIENILLQQVRETRQGARP